MRLSQELRSVFLGDSRTQAEAGEGVLAGGVGVAHAVDATEAGVAPKSWKTPIFVDLPLGAKRCAYLPAEDNQPASCVRECTPSLA